LRALRPLLLPVPSGRQTTSPNLSLPATVGIRLASEDVLERASASGSTWNIRLAEVGRRAAIRSDVCCFDPWRAKPPRRPRLAVDASSSIAGPLAFGGDRRGAPAMPGAHRYGSTLCSACVTFHVEHPALRSIGRPRPDRSRHGRSRLHEIRCLSREGAGLDGVAHDAGRSRMASGTMLAQHALRRSPAEADVAPTPLDPTAASQVAPPRSGGRVTGPDCHSRGQGGLRSWAAAANATGRCRRQRARTHQDLPRSARGR
jgi:hypothetical protein